MADSRYRNREGGSYGRSDSIFDDDDRNRGGSGRNREDRSFFQRAGEEVRSWLGGDDECRRGRGGYGDHQGRPGPRQDRGGDFDRSYGGSSGTGRVQSQSEANHAQGPQDRDEPWGGGSDWSAGRRQNWRGDMGQGSYSQTSGGGSPFDDHYRSWRDRQIDQLDREYDEYRQHRQQQFESDFTKWRQGRAGQQQGDNSGGGRTGSQGQAEGSGRTGTQGGSSRAMASGGATAEGGSNLTPDSSTGSSGRQGSRSRKS